MTAQFAAFPPAQGFPLPPGSAPAPLTPLELAAGAPSEAVHFEVPRQAVELFIRVIALFRDNQVSGGEAPTFEVRAGEGGPTALVVAAMGSPVSVPIIGTVGTDPREAAFATCERENNDVYLIHLSKIQHDRGP